MQSSVLMVLKLFYIWRGKGENLASVPDRDARIDVLFSCGPISSCLTASVCKANAPTCCMLCKEACRATTVECPRCRPPFRAQIQGDLWIRPYREYQLICIDKSEMFLSRFTSSQAAEIVLLSTAKILPSLFNVPGLLVSGDTLQNYPVQVGFAMPPGLLVLAQMGIGRMLWHLKF